MGKQAAYGTSLSYIDPDFIFDPETPEETGDVVIHQVGDITGPEISVETIDVTTHDSPDGFNEFLPGMADGGELSFDLLFDPGEGGHDRILDLVKRRIPLDFTITLPGDSGNFAFAGLFTKAGQTFPVKDALKASVSIKVSGSPVFTPPA
ncbi:MAG: phage tail tube protein [Verrucomicrobiota bacterium]